jgi:hypothetical protein
MNRRSNELEKALQNRNVSSDGVDYLRTALDPFHDYQKNPEGYPDMNSSRSVVLCLTQSTTLTCPGAVSWDALIYNAPFQMTEDDGTGQVALLCSSGIDAVHGSINVNTTDTSPQTEYSTFNIVTVNTGLSVHPNLTVNFAPTNYTSQAFHGKHDDLLDHASRLIGVAFEVHDISAEINKQGSVTVGSLPCNTTSVVRRYYDSTAASILGELTGIMKCYDVMAPPSLLAYASQYPNSATWEAKKGVYAVAKMSSIDNPVVQVEPAGIASMVTPLHHLIADGLTIANATHPNTFVDYEVSEVPHEVLIPPMVQRCNFDTTFAYFTGLHPDGSLRVVMRTFVEYFPRHGQVLLSSATPSPAYDAKALRLYSEIAPKLPVAVPVDWNAGGKWWSVIKSVAKEVIPTVLPMVTAIAPELAPFVAAGETAYKVGSAAVRASKKKQPSKPAPRKVNPQMGNPVIRRR